MSYPIIQPPWPLEFRKRSKKELKEYAEWFHRVKPARIAELTRAVTNSPGYSDWGPELTLQSLDVLSEWFEGQVETRLKTQEEIEEQRANLKFPIDIPKEQLTERTFSLAIDIGMYFGEVVLKNLPGTEWWQSLKDPRFADYGQPVILGFGKVTLNPVRVVVITAYRVSGNERADLRKLYDVWAEKRG